MVIYKITNSINSKVYVGQTVQSLEKRWTHHRWRSGTKNHPLYAAIRKHGLDSFQISVIEELPTGTPIEFLNAREIYWIAFYQSLSPTGYNLTSGGDGKFFLAEEVKAKISNTKMGHSVSQKARDKISLSLTGRIGPNKGRSFSEEWRAKIGAVQLGKKVSEETKTKMSEAQKARLAIDSTRTPAQIAVLKEMHKKNKGQVPWNKGKKATEEAKKNQSLAHLGKAPWNKGLKKS